MGEQIQYGALDLWIKNNLDKFDKSITKYVLYFEQADGLQVINQLLCSRGSLIEDRIEAAGVLAQITSPWISDNHKIQNLDHFVYNMVNALTGM